MRKNQLKRRLFSKNRIGSLLESLESRVLLSASSPGAVEIGSLAAGNVSPVMLPGAEIAQNVPLAATGTVSEYFPDGRSTYVKYQDWSGLAVPNQYIVSMHSGTDLLAIAQRAQLPIGKVARLGETGDKQTFAITTLAPVEQVYAWRKQFGSEIDDIGPNFILQGSAVVAPVNPGPNQWFLSNKTGTTPLTGTLTGFGQATGTNGADVNIAGAWNITAGSDSVIVAVLDTGIDFSHSALAGSIWTNPNEIAGNGMDDDGNGEIDDVHGWDFVNGDAGADDDFGHGTAVSGVIGAYDSAAPASGVNPNVKILPVKVLDSSGNGSLASIEAGIQYVVDMRAHNNIVAINASFNGNINFDSGLYNKVKAAQDAGILFVAAAGNDSSNNAAPYAGTVFNWDFEHGLSGWTGVGTQNTDYGVQYVSPSNQAWVKTPAKMISQTMTGLTPSTSYTVSATVWNSASGNGAEIYIDSTHNQTTSATTPGTVSVSFTTGNMQTTATVYFIKTSGTNAAFFDNVSLTATGLSKYAFPSDFEYSGATGSSAALTNIISVAATDNKDTLAPFSNFGSVVDIAAPGVDIDTTDWTTGGYSYWSGTSFSAPVVTGIAALAAASNATATMAQLRTAIVQYGVHSLTNLSTTVASSGRVDAALSVAAANNWGFETGNLVAWTAVGGVTPVYLAGHTGYIGTQIGSTSVASSLSQTISGLRPNTTYTLSVYAKRDANPTGASLQLINFGGGSPAIGMAATTYTQYSITFTTGSTNTSVKLVIYRAAAAGVTTVDDFLLQDTGRVDNWGFETGSIAGWSVFGSTAQITQTSKQAGDYAAKIPMSSSLSQTITGLLPSTTYSISVYGYVDSGYSSMSLSGFGGTVSPVFFGTGGYTQHTISFTTGSTNTSVTVALGSNTSSSSDYAYFDVLNLVL